MHTPLQYDEDHEQAEWIAYELTKDETLGEVKRKDKFITDPPPYNQASARLWLIISKEAQKRIEEEQDLVNKIVVPLKRTNTHWLIKKTELSLHTSYRTKHFLNSSNEEGVFNLFVSSKELNRALRILDTVIKALEKRNYLVYIIAGFLCVKMFGVELKFSLKEKSKRMLKQDTTYPYNQYDFISTGILILDIADFYCQHSIQRNLILNQLGGRETKWIIIGLIVASQAKIAIIYIPDNDNKLYNILSMRRRKRVCKIICVNG